MVDTPGSNTVSGSSTPNAARFQSQGHSAEELLKEQTYGLVTLNDFRKRRAEAVEQSERSQDGSGNATPIPSEAEGREPATTAVFKKRKKGMGGRAGGGLKKGGLSFVDDDEDEGGITTATSTPREASAAPPDSPSVSDTTAAALPPTHKKRLRPNAAISQAPQALTKSALLKESQIKEHLRKQFQQTQEAVRATEFILPFTFFAGKSLPGGACRMKKGDPIWLFLERARKVGAGLAATGGDRSKSDWARISVDDLMVVKGDLIIPHHFDFHYFLLNNSRGYNKELLFTPSAEPTPATPPHLLPQRTPAPSTDPEQPSTPLPLPTGLSTTSSRALAAPPATPDDQLEGFTDDPAATKVVDRRWYERHKHIYPASLWEEFDPARAYSAETVRKDGAGNAMFFSARR